jgi:hypothetical protein
LHHQLQGLKLLDKIKRGTEDHMDHNAITVDTLLRTNDRGSIVFDFRLVNKLDREVRLNGAVVNWTYRGGMQESIGHGDIFEPTSEINIDLPLDVDEWGWLNEGSPKVHETPIDPPLLVPGGTQDRPAYKPLQIKIHYTFTGRIDWHPCSDWDIFFSITLKAIDGHGIEVLPGAQWRSSQVSSREAIQLLKMS